MKETMTVSDPNERTTTVLDHQAKIGNTETKIASLNSAIAAQRKLIADAQATIPAIPARSAERENLIADIALGQATAEDLKTLDAQIAKEQRAYDDAKKKVAADINTGEAAIAGLERKLQDAQADLDTLNDASTAIMQQYVRGEAETVAQDYVDAALRLKDAYLRLRGLNAVLSGYGGRSFIGIGADRLYISGFALPQFDGVIDKNATWPGTIFSAEWAAYGNTFSDACAAEKDRMKKLGMRT
jgi:cell division protein FtsL